MIPASARASCCRSTRSRRRCGTRGRRLLNQSRATRRQRQSFGAVVDLDHPSARAIGAGRGVNDRGRVSPDVAAVRNAGYRSASRNDAGDVILGQTAKLMRSGRDQQRSVLDRYRIQMDPKRDHARQKLKRRLHVHKPRLECPRTETGHVVPIPHDDRTVLMPPQRPVGIGGLVEEDRTNRLGCRSEQAARDGRRRIKQRR